MRSVICLLTILTLSTVDVWGQTDKEDGDIIIDPVEYSASFPGGVDSLKSFIKRNLIQPTQKKTGRVFVSFVIDKDGTTSDFEIVRGLTKECDEKALEVLKKMPKWTPGTQQGIQIRQRFVMPVVFE
jgi:periplasmic protein TonB